MDAGYYYSEYQDFIGYKIGADINYVASSNSAAINNIYRVATNSVDKVTTQGVSVGVNYFFSEFYTFNVNYSWNELNRRGSEDPLIPAFNTPRNKFNIGLSGRDMQTRFAFFDLPIHNVGFNINYKWVQGFLFEGSPQFTGEIENYDLLDVQINKRIPKLKSTFKVGASNVLNKEHYEVYGGPLVGRLAYFQILVELN